MSRNFHQSEIEKQIPEINKRLHASGRLLGLSLPDIEDLISKTWVTFFENMDNFRGESKLSTYITGIYFNMNRQRKRKSYSQPIAVEDFDDTFDDMGFWSKPPLQPQSYVESLEVQGQIEDCIQKLNDKSKEIFLMKYVFGEDTKEICNNFGISVTNLGVMLFRAKNSLRKCLESKAEESVGH